MDDLRRRSFDVSIHAPREGCDATNANTDATKASFNSRTPGGVRRTSDIMSSSDNSVSIHAPREGCDLVVLIIAQMGDRCVSIHAPREGCDEPLDGVFIVLHSFNSRTPGGVRPGLKAFCEEHSLFQFTHPGRGATTQEVLRNEREMVSIHAPREGCDLIKSIRFTSADLFQFTHPGRGATMTGT